jgi:formylglycine-generating enzyme required for sulfatase activity
MYKLHFPGDDRPRDDIIWTEAASFCASRGARLPSEAKWEYAARGPDSLEYPWGNEWDQERVIGYRDPNEGTASIGSIPDGASWVGALDMSGNVWKWVEDWYDSSYYGSLGDGMVNPTGPASGTYRVFRGGSWIDSNPDSFRATFRLMFHPYYGNYRGGFRCARSR